MKLKKFFGFGGDKPPIYYRPESCDESIIQANVIEKNEYLLPNMSPKIVYDIGANIGVISAILAQVYPDATIYAFEPIEENFEILLKNVEPYPNIKPKKFGLGPKRGMRDFYPSDNVINHGGYSTEIKSDKEVVSCQIESMEEICKVLGPPELIKIDVEGAEHSILTCMSEIQLNHLKWISGELHGIKDFALLDFLSTKFNIQVQRNFMDVVYHFHAMNKTWTPASDQNTQPTAP